MIRPTMQFSFAFVAAVVLSGCGVNACERPDRYANSGEISGLAVPDDLTPLDRSNALQVPDVEDATPEPVAKRGGCLESPPEYFPGGMPR